MLKPRFVLILATLGVVAILAGWLLGERPAGETQSTVASGSPAFPGLAQKLGDAAEVQIQHQTKTLDLVLKDGKWGLADRGQYPIPPERLHELLTGLGELRLVEPRTSDPANYVRLGVENPTDPAATGTLLRVLTAKGEPIAELIVGHRRERAQSNVADTIYVRQPGEAQAWLAEGKLTVDADAQQWLTRDVLDIDHAKVASVVVSRDGAPLEFDRAGDKLVLRSPKGAPKLDETKLEEIGRGLEGLTLTDVKPADQLKADRLGEAVYTTTDGLVTTVTVSKAGEDIWARFAVRPDPAAKDAAAAKKQAGELQARLSPWAYEIGSWKERALVPTLEDLKAVTPPTPGGGGAPGGAQEPNPLAGSTAPPPPAP